MDRRALVAVAALATALSGCGGGGASQPADPAADGLDATPEAVATPDAPTEDVVASPSPSPTATATPTPSPTATPTEQPPTFDEVCAGRDDEAFIEVLTPRPDATVSDPFTVTGCGNTFEANYIYRVELPDGSTAVEDFGTMSCGNGCVGEFEQEVTVGTTGPITLVVFESSAEDGSEQSVVEVPLTVAE